MTTLWTLFAAVVRLWAWASHRAAAKWATLSVMAGKELDELTKIPKDESPQAGMMRMLKASEVMRKVNRAEDKYTRKTKRAETLTKLHDWLSKPRTVAGGVAGALSVPSVMIGATAAGVNVPGWIVAASDWVQLFLSPLIG